MYIRVPYGDSGSSTELRRCDYVHPALCSVVKESFQRGDVSVNKTPKLAVNGEKNVGTRVRIFFVMLFFSPEKRDDGVALPVVITPDGS